MKEYSWNSLAELFSAINDSCNYLIMRNYENMNNDEFLMEGHEDIDFLCDDPIQLIETLHAFPRKFFNKKVQNYILFKGQKVKIDIRYVGDDYYDSKWQADMLKNKIMNENGFWTMNSDDYFYSLVYHSILQKHKLSEEYRVRLSKMGTRLGITADTEKNFVDVLKGMMQEKGYNFVYPLDGTIPNRFDILETRINGRFSWLIRKCIGNLKQYTYIGMSKSCKFLH